MDHSRDVAFPRIQRSRLTPEAAVDQVVEEDELRRSGNQGSDRDEFSVNLHQRRHEVVDERLVTPNVPRHAKIVEGKIQYAPTNVTQKWIGPMIRSSSGP